MPDVANASGLYSLGGFAYQIRAFVYRLESLEDNMQVEYETLDDISIRNVDKESIEKYCSNICCTLKSKKQNIAIQVKHTAISPAVVKQIFLNWLLIEKKETNIDQYILDVDEANKPHNGIFDISASDFYKEICASKPRSKLALITKVKEAFEKDEKEFVIAFEKIKKKASIHSYSDINKEIYSLYSKLLLKSAVTDVVYQSRVKELLTHYTAEIMEAASYKRPYVCTYESFCCQLNSIIENITNNQYLPQYYKFQRAHPIDLNDLSIANARECRQLKACSNNPQFIQKHLMHGQYYLDLKLHYLENNQKSFVQDMEITTHENFVTEKEVLKSKGKDEPLRRLDGTIQRSNDYAANEQIRSGIAIHLTKEIIDKEMQISWKDADNEES
ncbi:MAG: hypothetical protein VB082_09840 [Christensenella sp.]|nr:hypothetical protein [Christensenella sp.]